MQLTIGSRLGHYEILGPLGTGGMGEVFRARDQKLGRQVALKGLRAEHAQDADRLRRFEREAFSASALNHPNIVTIYDIGRSDGAPYIVMELVEGQTLRERLRGAAIPLSELLAVALQTADGLAKAHDAGIVHRDLKPENLMITVDGVVKILDFGLAKLTEGSSFDSKLGTLGTETSAGVILGTVGYMSPEQASGKPVDYHADQFALGTVLYEMATGRRAFDGSTAVQTLSAIIETHPESASSVNSDVPAPLCELIAKLLAKKASSRFASTRELAAALAQLREDLASGRAPPPYAALKDAARSAQPALICPSCQHQNPAEVKFCGDCGARFLDDESPTTSTPSDPLPAGERRQCTVLTCYLSGYANIVEQVAPRQIEEILHELQEMAREAVESFSGVVNELNEEEIVSLFGLPKSHEDDFLRAARAARMLHQRVRDVLGPRFGRALHLQSGISTGTVVAQPGSMEGRLYKISGRAVDHSLNLATHADADELLVAPDTERLLSPFFEIEKAEQLRMRGRGLVPTYRVLTESKVRTRLEASEASGMTPYSGRERELETLVDCLARSVAGEARLVTIVGEAGAGKSRLLYELAREIDTDSVKVLPSRCQSFGARTPYLPWIEMLRKVLGLDGEQVEGELARVARDAVRDMSGELEVYLPVYFHLLSVESKDHPLPKHLSGEDLRLAILESLSALFTSWSKKQTVALLIEDWHWADEASRAALRHLVGLVGSYPMLIAVTYRPELSIDWGELGFHTRLSLGPLAPSSSFNVIRSALGAEVVPDGLEKLIHEKTGGNPFFNEEVCRALLEAGAVRVEHGRAELSGPLGEIHIPDSVQAVILSRLDRLDDEDRDLLRRASVIGTEFSREVLQRTLSDRAALGSRLERLKSSGLVGQVRLLPEAIYRFNHILTQEVAYDSLLQHQRKQLHGAVGVAIEEVYAGRHDEYLDVLAHHFSLAESWEKAVRYGRASITRAVNLTQFAEAFVLLERTQSWLEKLPDTQRNRETLCQMLLQEERICETKGDRERQQELIDRLLSSLPEDSAASRGEVYLRQGELFAILGKEEQAQEALDEARRLGRELNDPAQVRNALRSMGFLAWKRGRQEEAKKLNEEAVAIDRKICDSEALAGDLHNLAQVTRALRQYPEALRYLDESLEISERHRDPIRAYYAINTTASVYRDMGDLEAALEWLQRGTEVMQHHRLPLHMTFALSNLAGVRRDRGEHEEAIRLLREALALGESANYAEGRATTLRSLGDVLLTVGRRGEAADCVRRAADLFAQLRDPASEVKLRMTLAALVTEDGNHGEALEAWKRSTELCRLSEDAPNELIALEGLARSIRKVSGDSEAAIDEYQRGAELASRLGQPGKEAELRNEIGILQWGRQNYEEALSQYECARAIFVELGDDVHAGLMLNSIGVTLKDMGRPADARERLQEGLVVHQRSGERMLEGHALAILGGIEASEADTPRAVERFQNSLAIRRELGDERGEAWMCYELARLLRASGRGVEADGYLESATQLASRVGDARLTASCKELRTT